MFSVCLGEQTFRILVARTYRRKGRNSTTKYIELVGPPNGCFDFYFLDSVICSVHILPPADGKGRYIVQDLYDGDMYLRLIRV